MTGALWIATLGTRNFEFEGCGNSSADAVDVLKQGLRAHGKQYGLDGDWWGTDDFNVTKYERGLALRDGQEI